VFGLSICLGATKCPGEVQCRVWSGAYLTAGLKVLALGVDALVVVDVVLPAVLGLVLVREAGVEASSHELERHGHALLVVGHVCGIFSGGWLVWEVLLVGGWIGCPLEWYAVHAIEGRRVEGGSRKRHVHEPSQASTGSCDLRLQARAAYTIDSRKHHSSASHLLTHTHTHNAVYSRLQHAQAARRPRLPRPAAREGPAPPVLAQDEVSRQRSYRNKT
jgi:hypothetical protein